MNHVCLLNKRSGEYNSLLSGKKTMIIRGSKLRKAPYEHVFPGDRIYFSDRRKNIVLTAFVEGVESIAVNSEKELRNIIKENETQLNINQRTYRKLRKNHFIVLIRLVNVKEAEHLEVNDNIFSYSKSWMLVGNLNYQ